MRHHRFARISTLAVAVCALTAPSAGATQDFRNPDNRDAAPPTEARQDLRSPDSRDAAAGRGTFNAPEVTVVKISEPSSSPSSGLDWGDAGIGAGALLGMILIGLGGTLFVVHRRHGRGQPASA